MTRARTYHIESTMGIQVPCNRHAEGNPFLCDAVGVKLVASERGWRPDPRQWRVRHAKCYLRRVHDLLVIAEPK